MEKYLPSYPDMESDAFYIDVMRKFEFKKSYDYLPETNESEGTFFHYQNNIARFLSSKTIYDSLLLIHEMGTGKSGSAIATAHLVRTQDPSFRRTIVLANGKTQLNNFRYEIMNRLPFLYDKYKDTTDPRLILRREGFSFETYRIFAKSLQNRSPHDIKRLYENSIIIMDEIHNITASLKSGGGGGGGDRVLTNVQTYDILYDFVHALQNRKLLCLTGTPIRDKPQEIAKVLNMVIPVKNKFPVGDDFKNIYLKPIKTISVLGDATLTTYEFKPEMLTQFLQQVQGYVSFLKKSVPKNITINWRTNPNFGNTSLEHFKVYANTMKDPQNAIYINDFIEDLEAVVKQPRDDEDEPNEEEETAESTPKISSLAYSKSKQSSLMVFPDRKPASTYINPIFEKTTSKGVLKQGKFIKTIGWTKEMRTLFPKDISLDEKLDRLSKYSCIYETIVRQILFHPSELVYIYSFLKSGSGIYVLASFLVEYFGFEIVRKVADVRTIATDKRRLLILNHDFMSDADLREMVDFFNKNENALAEYIQVVIGTKQTKEGITLKNIRQIHVVQPEWNYADISQAIARGIRVNSHDALLRKIGSITVNIFQHVSVPKVDDEPDVEYSIDIDQYRRSEIKDTNIKMVERQLLVSSWDCFLNQERNTGTVDGSRECEYQKCVYQCRGIPPNFEPMYDYDTYNMYYSTIPQQLIRNRIQDIFHMNGQLTMDALQQQLITNEKNRSLIYQVLEEIIMDCVPIRNQRLDVTYLKTSRVYGINGAPNNHVDICFLVPDFTQYKPTDRVYNTIPIFSMPSSFLSVNSTFYQRRFASILRVVMDMFFTNKDAHERCRTIILGSPLFLQENLVENILLQQIEKRKTNEFFSFILNHYTNQARLEKKGDVYISTLLSDVRRELDTSKIPLEWKSVEISSAEETTAEESNEFIKKYITENPYKYYGILEVSKDKTVFKIRDVRNLELVFGSNKAKVPKGEVCAGSFSRKKSGLIDILLTLDWKPSPEELEDVPSMDKMKQVLSKKDKDRLWKDLDTTIENTNDDTLKIIYILNMQNIPVLCDRVRRRFIDLDLIHQKRV